MIWATLSGLRRSNSLLQRLPAASRHLFQSSPFESSTTVFPNASLSSIAQSNLGNELRRGGFPVNAKPISTGVYVRMAGCSYYTSREDIKLLLKSCDLDFADVDDVESEHILFKNEEDELSNQATWILKAKDHQEARNVVKKVSGRVCGLKVVRAYTVSNPIPTREVRISLSAVLNPKREPHERDRKAMVRYTTGNVFYKGFHRLRPRIEEYDRSVLVRNITNRVAPSNVWFAFSSYDLARVVHLPGLHTALVVFRTADECERCLREKGILHNLGNRSYLAHVARL